MGVFHVFQIVHMIPNCATHHIYKSFIRPLLDYADVIYDQPSNALFSKKIESVQYNATLAITRAISSSR